MGFDFQLLENAGIQLIDGDRGKNYPKHNDFMENGYCLFLSAKNVTKSGFQFQETLFINETKDRELRAGKLKYGDIVLTTRGTVGNVAYYDNNNPYKHIRINSGMIIIRADNKLWNPKFLYFILKSELLKEQIINLISGSAVPQLPARDIRKFILPVINRSLQNKITNIISDINDKVNLNIEINQTLEKMSQTLFKSWFVDFDPVIDNALDAGNPIPEALQTRAKLRQKVRNSADFKPLPAEIRSLFPSEFEETELGWVPKGWKEGTLPEIAFINSTSWTNKNQPDYINYVDLSNAKDGRIYSIEKLSFNDAPSRARRILKKDDLIFGLVRPANRSFAYVHVDGLTGSTGFAVIRAQKTIYKNFIYYFVTYDKNIEELARIADGGAYPAIKPDDICTLPLIIPSINIIEKFDELTSNFREMMNNSLIQNEYLTNLRGTLLPKLISGELSLEDLPDLTTDTEAA